MSHDNDSVLVGGHALWKTTRFDSVPMAPAWTADALCAQIDPELFFPDEGGGSTLAAKKICGGCDVRAKCLDYALANRERFGIWGGTSPRERAGMWLGGDSE